MAISAQDKYTVKVPGGLAFSEFRGYEAWQAISISRNERVVAVILGNQAFPKLIHCNKVEKGGHFAAWEQPELFCQEVRAGFRSLRY